MHSIMEETEEEAQGAQPTTVATPSPAAQQQRPHSSAPRERTPSPPRETRLRYQDGEHFSQPSYRGRDSFGGSSKNSSPSRRQGHGFTYPDAEDLDNFEKLTWDSVSPTWVDDSSLGETDLPPLPAHFQEDSPSASPQSVLVQQDNAMLTAPYHLELAEPPHYCVLSTSDNESPSHGGYPGSGSPPSYNAITPPPTPSTGTT